MIEEKIDPRTMKSYPQGVSNGITTEVVEGVAEEAIRAIVRDELEKASPKTEFLRLSQGVSQTAEPAPGSDAEHPPVGYRLEPRGGIRNRGYITWGPWGDNNPANGWFPAMDAAVGEEVTRLCPPIANPIPANEGDSRVTESVAIPVGWVSFVNGPHINGATRVVRDGRWVKILPDLAWQSTEAQIKPDPSIPWGEGYEAILPSEAQPGDSFEIDGEWTAANKPERWLPVYRDRVAWRRKVQPEAKAEGVKDDGCWCSHGVTCSNCAKVLADDRDRALARVAELEAELRAANHRADVAENEEAHRLKRAVEKFTRALEEIHTVDARSMSEYALICKVRNVAREALR